MSLVLNKLSAADIDEKIYLNQNGKIDIQTLEEMIKEELSENIWMGIRLDVQRQFYKEQLAHIAKRKILIEGKPNPYLSPDYLKILDEYEKK